MTRLTRGGEPIGGPTEGQAAGLLHRTFGANPHEPTGSHASRNIGVLACRRSRFSASAGLPCSSPPWCSARDKGPFAEKQL